MSVGHIMIVFGQIIIKSTKILGNFLLLYLVRTYVVRTLIIISSKLRFFFAPYVYIYTVYTVHVYMHMNRLTVSYLHLN